MRYSNVVWLQAFIEGIKPNPNPKEVRQKELTIIEVIQKQTYGDTFLLKDKDGDAFYPIIAKVAKLGENDYPCVQINITNPSQTMTPFIEKACNANYVSFKEYKDDTDSTRMCFTSSDGEEIEVEIFEV